MRSRASITHPRWVRMEMLDARIPQSTQVGFGENIVLAEEFFLDRGIQEFRLSFGRVFCIRNKVHHMRPYLTAEFELAAQCLRKSDTRKAHRRAWQFAAQFDYRTWTVFLPDAIRDPIQECIDWSIGWMYGAMYVVQDISNLYYGMDDPRDVLVPTEVRQRKMTTLQAQNERRRKRKQQDMSHTSRKCS